MIRTGVRSNGLVKPCCMPNNTRRSPDSRPGVVVNVCKTCGCRHIEMTLEPGHFKMALNG